MTVRDAIRVLPDDGDIRIVYADFSIEFHRRNPLTLEAYGDFVIDELNAFPMGDNISYELVIALRPVKA